jgi:hypothetical protein
MIYDTVIDDIPDVIYNTKECKVWAVFRNNFFSNLSSIPDYLNEFGQKGGFDKILDFLYNKNGEKVITLKHI